MQPLRGKMPALSHLSYRIGQKIELLNLVFVGKRLTMRICSSYLHVSSPAQTATTVTQPCLPAWSAALKTRPAPAPLSFFANDPGDPLDI